MNASSDPPEVVRLGVCYQACDGAQRLVWAIRGGAVCFFSRRTPEEAWIAGHPPGNPPTIEQFVGEVVAVARNAAQATQPAPDTYGEGEW